MSDFFLPEALILNIWSSLSIKSTVRFRCVSKSWCASLSDPHFIYKNLTLSEADNLFLLVNRKRPHYSVVSHETLLATPLRLPPEVPVPGSYNCVLTPPCDDLVCFNDVFGHSIGLWNLTTSETKTVPRLVLDDGSPFSFLTLGFGFDEERKEYKIVQILNDRDNYVAYVYSLSRSSNNSWRKVGEPNMPYNKDFLPADVYSRSYRDGTFYWGDSDLIVSFDMSSEVFSMISIPLQDGCYNSGIKQICKLKEGSMFVTTYNAFFDCCHVVYELWALLEFGVAQSWTKLSVIDCGEDYDPFGFWRNELILRCYNSQLLITDPFKRESKEVHMDEPCDISRCLVWRKGKKNTSINSILLGV